MSSPLQHDNSALQVAALSPGVQHADDVAADIAQRPMRVKVLYTFDEQSQSNCLARLPNPMNVPTAHLDEATQVGVIELKACIQAVVAASPELVAKLDHDYTVYAYDYSEHDTPLVGQGMLSWILASASSAPAHQSKTMVTGRVCNNLLGLFSSGMKETLEVKLKLVPVPTCLQSEYVESMEKYRRLSKVMPEGFDHAAWADFLKANPAIEHLARRSPGDPPLHGPVGGLETIHQLLAPQKQPENEFGGSVDHDHGLSQPSPQPSRAAGSVLSSRPASRASMVSDRPGTSQSYSLHSNALPDANEDERPKKRIQVTKATKPGRASFGANQESLRIAASSAASLRLYKPGPSMAASAESIPRAPTPHPDVHGLQQHLRRERSLTASALRQDTTAIGQRYVSPYAQDAFPSDAAESMVDERAMSVGQSPAEFASSPPGFPQGDWSSPPSSPALPSFTDPADSGFASDPIAGQSLPNDGDRDQASSGIFSTAQTKISRRRDGTDRTWTAVAPGPMELLPKTMIPRVPPAIRRASQTPGLTADLHRASDDAVQPFPTGPVGRVSSAGGNQIQQTSQGPAPPMPVETNRPGIDTNTSQLLSTIAGANPGCAVSTSYTPHPANPPALSRAISSETANEHLADGVLLDTNCDSGSLPAQPRSGSGAKRSRYIKNKLASSLAAGEMPPFCNNCGEIETPTWRKAYARVVTATPEEIGAKAQETGIVGFEIVKSGNGGTVQQCRVFKSSLAPEGRDTDHYQTLQLCNPCGLWFNKKGEMRPPEIWNRAAFKAAAAEKAAVENAAANPEEKAKRKRMRNSEKAPRKKRQLAKGDSVESATASMIAADGPHIRTGTYPQATEDLEQATCRPRASSLQAGESSSSSFDEAAAAAALKRAIQSSPIRSPGSKQSPIEIEPDLTPKPVRRLLFRSPSKTRGPVSLEPGIASAEPGIQGAEGGEQSDENKENSQPEGNDKDIERLFEDFEPGTQVTPLKVGMQGGPKTPTTSRSKRGVLTPLRGQGSALRPELLTPTRSCRRSNAAPVTPFTAHIAALLSDHAATSPLQGVDFSSIASFTPGRGDAFHGYVPDDLLSSDLAMPSPPWVNMYPGLSDDMTALGLWSGTSIFDDAAVASAQAQSSAEQGEGVAQDSSLPSNLVEATQDVVSDRGEQQE